MMKKDFNEIFNEYQDKNNQKDDEIDKQD